MKNLAVLFFSIAILFFIPGSAMAQVKIKTEIASVKQQGNTVDFTITAAKPFIFGGNRYILYIGDKAFYLNKQSAREGKGTITFFIPASDFKTLTEGAGIYLTYGQFPRHGSEQGREELSKQSNRCWPLGKFSRSMLDK